MIKALITVVLVVVALLGIKELHAYWQQVKTKEKTEVAAIRGAEPAPPPKDPSALAGMPTGLESSLESAKKAGAPALKAWLKQYHGYVADPKLAAIELDYVVLAGAKNFVEAKEMFAAVKQRTPTNSPVYPRIKQLERTYQ
jgi:hypothetical protein